MQCLIQAQQEVGTLIDITLCWQGCTQTKPPQLFPVQKAAQPQQV